MFLCEIWIGKIRFFLEILDNPLIFSFKIFTFFDGWSQIFFSLNLYFRGRAGRVERVVGQSWNLKWKAAPNTRTAHELAWNCRNDNYFTAVCHCGLWGIFWLMISPNWMSGFHVVMHTDAIINGHIKWQLVYWNDIIALTLISLFKGRKIKNAVPLTFCLYPALAF